MPGSRRLITPTRTRASPPARRARAEETTDGSTSTIDVVVSGDDTSVVVPGGGSATLHITDTYTHATGSLVVTKTIDGPAAGSQGEVKISVTCGGTALAEFVIPAGHSASQARRLTAAYRPARPAPSTRPWTGQPARFRSSRSVETRRSRSWPARKPRPT